VLFQNAQAPRIVLGLQHGLDARTFKPSVEAADA